VSILPGIYASQISGKLSTNSYESISTVTVGVGGSSSITFSSIPSTYKHLQIRGIARTTEAVAANILNYRLNGDTGTNYAAHLLYGDGSAAGAFANTSLSYIYGAGIPGSSANASIFDAVVIDILDYTNTNKNKVVRSLGGYDANGSGDIRMNSGVWLNTAAVNQITLTTGGANNFPQYSSFALYGIK